jgi:hypothetical protein
MYIFMTAYVNGCSDVNLLTYFALFFQKLQDLAWHVFLSFQRITLILQNFHP